jgi:predicted nuclease of predicted toxin-antitoxin system
MPIRFHLDENVSRSVAVGLRQRGIDVTTSADAGLIGASDEQQLAYARESNRVLYTHDDDFLSLHARGDAHAGIVYCSPGSRSIRQMLSGLVMIAEVLEPEEMQNHVEFL